MKYKIKDDGCKELLYLILNKDVKALRDSYLLFSWNTDLEKLCDSVTELLQKDHIGNALIQLKNAIAEELSALTITEYFIGVFGFREIVKSIVKKLSKSQPGSVFLFNSLFRDVDFQNAALLIEPGITYLVEGCLGGYNIKAIWIPATVTDIETSFVDRAQIKDTQLYFETPFIDERFEYAHFGVTKQDFIDEFGYDVLE